MISLVGLETEYGLQVSAPERKSACQHLLEIMFEVLPREYGITLVPTRSVTNKHDAMLSNGARLYIDLDHPEYSTPIVLKAEELVAADEAGAALLTKGLQRLQRENPQRKDLAIYKTSVDRAGNSFGCHENYLVTPDVFEELTRCGSRAHAIWLPFLATRSLFTGAGRFHLAHPKRQMSFELSPRSSFIQYLTGLDTTQDRALINTRDRPYADAKRFRRLHVITGEANRSEFSTFLKVGTTQIILTMLNDDALHCNFSLANPVQALWRISRRPFNKVELQSGDYICPLDIQFHFLELASRYVEEKNLESIFGRVVQVWDETLNDLKAWPDIPLRTVRRLDWLIKQRLVKSIMTRYFFNWGDARLGELDDRYHLLGADSIYSLLVHNGQIETLLQKSTIMDAIQRPPSATRARSRASRIRDHGNHIVSGAWEEIVYDNQANEVFPDPRGPDL